MKWFKNSKNIVVNLYTFNTAAYNYFPVVEAKKLIPKWFKELAVPYYNSPHDNDFNMKNCVGVMDYYTKGFIMPLWSDLYLKIGKIGSTEYEWQYSDLKSELATHLPQQYKGVCAETEYQHLKLTSPWVATCDEDVQFLITQPDWRFDMVDNIHISSGVLNFKYQMGLNINLFFKREEDSVETILKNGTPLLHIVPLTERKVILKTHLVDPFKFDSIFSKSTPISFTRPYQTRKNILRSKKCPYRVINE